MATKRKKAVPALAPSRIAGAIASMAQPRGTQRFDASRQLMATAAKYPERLSPHFDAVATLLEGASKIILWNALRILADLAPLVSQRRLEATLPRYLSLIQGGDLVSAANAIIGAGQIATAVPELRGRIVRAMLGVEQAEYATPECRNVAIGHVLDALARMPAEVRKRDDVVEFISRQRTNPRPAVRRRAEGLCLSM